MCIVLILTALLLLLEFDASSHALLVAEATAFRMSIWMALLTRSCMGSIFQVDNYHEATGIALKTGIKDAWGTAGMTTINSYMDLAANVLVLWYGGWLAIEQDGRMTAGKLITYQLYWNMMDGAYKSLIDMVTSFTRAAGAAQVRFISLVFQARCYPCPAFNSSRLAH